MYGNNPSCQQGYLPRQRTSITKSVIKSIYLEEYQQGEVIFPLLPYYRSTWQFGAELYSLYIQKIIYFKFFGATHFGNVHSGDGIFTLPFSACAFSHCHYSHAAHFCAAIFMLGFHQGNTQKIGLVITIRVIGQEKQKAITFLILLIKGKQKDQKPHIQLGEMQK